jgi:lysophospholipase L1-like esterase
MTFSYSEYNNIIIFVGSTNDIYEISCKTFQENIEKVIEEIRKCNHSDILPTFANRIRNN